jgi:nitrogen regulatory protein PII
VNDDFVDHAIECIQQNARTGLDGNIGDGKIFILQVEDVIQISDRCQGPGAV